MNLSDFNNKITQMGKPVIVDFWAPWCGPCRVTKPILEKLALEFAGTVDFLPINADEAREVLEHFHVSGIPTVLALRDGRIIGRVTGTQNETGYRSMFKALAEGSEIKIPITPFDRYLRLGAGALLFLVGLSTSSWLVAGLGGFVAFLGIYDRCPIWTRISRLIKNSRS